MTRLTAFTLLSAATIGSVVPRYFALGFTHILPDGLDHILFILALFFLSRNFGLLLVQMTLFTLGHSLTLGLALHGLVSVPSAVVEVAIALSIVLVACENLVLTRLRQWRPWLVFGSGLIHGLGFAHSFSGSPIPEQDFLPALFSFNLGIEGGQLAVVGLAYASVTVWWRRELYVRRIARPASIMIATVGGYWAVERCF